MYNFFKIKKQLFHYKTLNLFYRNAEQSIKNCSSNTLQFTEFLVLRTHLFITKVHILLNKFLLKKFELHYLQLLVFQGAFVLGGYFAFKKQILIVIAW